MKLIVNSHAHFDHAGGIAALQRASGATVAASAIGARAIESGMPNPDDPQYALGRAFMSFPPVAYVRAVADGETLRVGPLAHHRALHARPHAGKHHVDVAVVRGRRGASTSSTRTA